MSGCMARSRNSKSGRADPFHSPGVGFGWVSVRFGCQVGLRVTRMLERPDGPVAGGVLIKGSLARSKLLIDSSPVNLPGRISLVSVGGELMDQSVVVMLAVWATWLEVVSQQPSRMIRMALRRVCAPLPQESSPGPHRVLDGVDCSVCLLSVSMVGRLPGLLYGTIRTYGQHGNKVNLCSG